MIIFQREGFRVIEKDFSGVKMVRSLWKDLHLKGQRKNLQLHSLFQNKCSEKREVKR
jgi:hypothetical protein